MFSRRLAWSTPANAITLAVAELRDQGANLLDLTETNPTRASLSYPLPEIAAAFAEAASRPYAPEPLGLLSAREAISAEVGASPEDVVLTASTSEAYSFLFRLLCDPGDELLIPTPSYPLFEHLARLDSVQAKPYPFEFHRRWTLDAGALQRAVSPRSKAVVVVSPNNPTGSVLTSGEQDTIASICAASKLAMISDEVFSDYALDPPPAAASSAYERTDVPSFTLGGLSKSAGLPHLKLGWICIGGPMNFRKEARQALELIADNYLSVSTPVQEALPRLLQIAPTIRIAILSRLRANLESLRSAFADCAAAELLPLEGGWSAVVRIPRLSTDEEFALGLLSEQHVLVHPGYFFDFPSEGFLVLSLLTGEDVFNEGARRLVSHLGSRLR